MGRGDSCWSHGNLSSQFPQTRLEQLRSLNNEHEGLGFRVQGLGFRV